MSIIYKSNSKLLNKQQIYNNIIKYFSTSNNNNGLSISTTNNENNFNIRFQDTDEYKQLVKDDPSLKKEEKFKKISKAKQLQQQEKYIDNRLIEKAKSLPHTSSPLSDPLKRIQYESLMRANQKPIIGKDKKHLYDFSTEAVDPNELFSRIPFSYPIAAQFIERMGLCGHKNSILQTIEYLDSNSIPMDIFMYSSLLSALANCRDIDTSLILFKRLLDNGIQPSNYIFNSLIDVHMKNGLVDDSISIIKSMESTYGLVPDHVNYTSLIHGCVENKKVDMGLQLFSEARNKGMVPDAVTITVLIDACAKENRVEKAFSFYDELEYLNLKPTEVTFNALINACAKRSDDYYYLKAFELLQEMDMNGFKPDVITYTSLLNAAAKRGEIPVVEKIFNELLHNRTDFKTKPDERVFCTVIMAYANNQVDIMKSPDKKGLKTNIEKAIKVFDQLGKRKLQVSNYSLDSLLRVYANANRLNLAQELFDTKYQQFNIKPSLMTYNIMIKMYMQNKRFEDGLKLFEKMKKEGIEPDYKLYLEILYGTTKFGYAKTCLKFVKEMNQKGFPPVFHDIQGILKRYDAYPEIINEIKSLSVYTPRNDPNKTVLFNLK